MTDYPNFFRIPSESNAGTNIRFYRWRHKTRKPDNQVRSGRSFRSERTSRRRAVAAESLCARSSGAILEVSDRQFFHQRGFHWY
jgi:hypothetical protein